MCSCEQPRQRVCHSEFIPSLQGDPILARSKGAVVAVCDTYIDSTLSVPFWEERMGYSRRAIIFRKPLT
jgi:hypothetical protein